MFTWHTSLLSIVTRECLCNGTWGPNPCQASISQVEMLVSVEIHANLIFSLQFAVTTVDPRLSEPHPNPVQSELTNAVVNIITCLRISLCDYEYH